MDWNTARYADFADLRLRPALDLLSRVPLASASRVVDLGCGAGAAAESLRRRFPKAELIGVDPSPAMREAAEATGLYARLEQADAAGYAEGGGEPADLVFSNAALHWAGDHEGVLPALLRRVRPGGALAVQMPRQFGEPSHRLLWQVARTLFPERFPPSPPEAPVAKPGVYRRLLEPLASGLDIWETVYQQRLAPTRDGLHPVAAFTRSTAARPYLAKLSEGEQAAFLAAHAEALTEPYPQEEDGGAWLPFRRLFFVVTA